MSASVLWQSWSAISLIENRLIGDCEKEKRSEQLCLGVLVAKCFLGECKQGREESKVKRARLRHN